MCVCVCVKEKEREIVCVLARKKERERDEGEKETERESECVNIRYQVTFFPLIKVKWKVLRPLHPPYISSHSQSFHEFE